MTGDYSTRGNLFTLFDNGYISGYPMTADERDELEALHSDVLEYIDFETFSEGMMDSYYIESASQALQDGEVDVNRRTAQVPAPTATSLEDFQMIRIEKRRKDNAKSKTEFYADAIVKAKVRISQVIDGTNISSLVHQWFRIHGTVDLSCNTGHEAETVSVYSPWDKSKSVRLSDYLIPIISKEQLDGEASIILNKCQVDLSPKLFYKIDGERMADKLKVKVVYASFTRHHSICGELVVRDTIIATYNEDGRKGKPISVSAGTIVVDKKACGSAEKVNETIIHELVHYELHWLFFYMQSVYQENKQYLCSLLNLDDGHISFEKYERLLDGEDNEPIDNHEWTPIEWAEWQAINITRHIQMPTELAAGVIKSAMEKWSKIPTSSVEEKYARVVSEVAFRFNVTCDTARKRMAELGYPEALRCGKFIDERWVPTYKTSNGEPARNGTTYDISVAELVHLYENDDRFREEVDQGIYIYTEGHLCLRGEKYITYGADEPKLTEWARNHIDKCCILFSTRFRPRVNWYDWDAFHSDCIGENPLAKAILACPIEELMAWAAEISQKIANLPVTFGATLAQHRKDHGLTQEKLAEMLDIDAKSIRRYEEAKKPPITKQMIVRLGVALQLPGAMTEDMLNKAGKPYDLTDEKDIHLKHTADVLVYMGLEVCDNYLIEHKCLPLRSRKYVN